MLSVIMPTINIDNNCLPSINSILNQNFPIELVIVVDGGKQTVNIDDDRVKIIQLEKNIGHIEAMNIGYKNTKFDFVTVHDNDDFSVPERFDKLFKNINKELAVSSYLTVNYEKENKQILKKFNSSSIVAGNIVKPPAHHCCVVLHKKIYDILGEFGYRRYMVADSERMIKLGIYLLLLKKPLKIVPEPLYIWNRNDKNYLVIKNDEFREQCGHRKIIAKKWKEILKMTPKEFLKFWNVYFK